MDKNIHSKDSEIIKKIEWLFHVIPLKRLRHTDKVDFDIMSFFHEFNGIDIVTHQPWAYSPWRAWWKSELWYMHRWQEDNLITLSWNRYVELYTKEHWKIEKFEISHNCIKWDWKIIHDWPWILWWPTWVFHRNYSPEGSSSMNFAVRDEKFNVDTEFNIYDLDTKNWEFKVARLWKLDQPSK
jgi:hypothetical protein